MALLTLAAAVFAGVSSEPAAAAATTTGWLARPLCGTTGTGHMSCHGLRLVRGRAPAGAATVRRPAGGGGPAGGYSPARLAAGYGLNPNAFAATHQTVAIVDAYDDPTVRSDLNAFDRHYRLPKETSASLRVVNQRGTNSPRPEPDEGWAGEIGLDVQAVRGICHKCRILLVEADSDSDADLASAVNRAAKMGADEISNSYGGTENDPDNTKSVVAAYNHPGVVITASSGDSGWYDWDGINEGAPPSNTPEIPAAYNTVIGVGGTSLYLDSAGRRISETVWNNDGQSDVDGWTSHHALGASGSGCSTLYHPRPWQKVAGYTSLGCGSRRSSVDIAADADPVTGYDVYQTYPESTGSWATVGGTSLSSPLVAAMWALAGGPGGVRYPAMSLYGHYTSARTRHTHDVTSGGTGLCGGASVPSCLGTWGGTNPNVTAGGLVDCAFRASGSAVLANRYQCDARRGYDGVSGVGTPGGVSVFKPMSPTAAIAHVARVRAHARTRFSAASRRDPFPGGRVVRYVWHWGDGHVTRTTRATVAHRYAATGRYAITLKVIDNYGRSDTTMRRVKVRR